MLITPKILALPLTLALATACGSDNISGVKDGQTELTLNFCGLPPEWLAFQNEGEGWQRVTADASGIVELSATPRVSIAFAFGDFGFSSTVIVNTTADELKTDVPCDLSFGTKSLTGNVAGLTGEQAARITIGEQSASADVANPDFEFEFLPSTPVDLVALRFASFFSSPPDKVIIRRGLVPQNLSISTLDFDASEAQQLASRTLTLANMGSDFGLISTEYMTSNGTIATIGDMSVFGGTTAVAYPAVPSSLQEQSDLHALTITASSATGTREVTQYFRTAVDKTITFGPHVNAPTVSQVATSPYLRMRATLAAQSEYPTAVGVGFSQGNQSEFRSVDILTTAGFHGGAPATWDLVIPDFSGTGYQNAWGLQSGAPVSWDVTGYNAGSHILATAPVDGQALSTAVRSSTTSFAQSSVRGAKVRRSLYRLHR